MPIKYLNRSRGSLGSSFYDFTLAALPAGVSLTRASTGWRFNSSGVLVPETTDAPRFQYDPVGLSPRGLLIEGAVTNSFTRSDEFDNAAWTKTRCSVVANAATSPDGTANADQLVEDGTASQSRFVSMSGLTWAIGETGIVSVYAKANTRNWIYIGLPTAFGTERAFFDVLNGVVGTKTAGVTAFIMNVGGGWYRCSVLAVATAALSTNVNIAMASADNTLTYSGDGASSLYLYRATYSKADFVSSAVPAVASAVTRAEDVALVTNANALADQCWIVKGRTPRKISGGAVNVAFQVDDGSGSNRRTLRYGTDGKLHAIATVGGVDQCDLDLGAVANDTDFAVAVRWANDKFAASLNGGAIVTDLSGQNPLGLTTARIGRSSVGNHWNSTIRTIRTLPTASDTDLPLLAA
jgi:hypothetical protein